MNRTREAKRAGRGSRVPSPAGLIILLLIVALAFALRFVDLGRQSLWYDEGVSAYLTTLSLPELTQWTADDVQPPLYYYLLWAWARLFGQSEAALRGLSLLFSLATVPLAWYAGRRLFSERAGLLAALLFATSPLYIWYAQEARNYALLTFLGTLSSILLFDAVGAKHSPAVPYEIPVQPANASPLLRWAAYVLVSSAALYTHYFAGFLLLFHGIYVLMVWFSAGRATRWLVEAGIAWGLIGLSYLPWLPHMIGRFGQDQSYWEGALKVDEALRKLLISFSVGESVLEPIGWPLAVGFLALLGLCVAALLLSQRCPGVSGSSRQGACHLPVLFLALYLLLPVAGVLLLAIWIPKLDPRYFMLASPPYLLLFAGGIDALLQAGRSAPHVLGRMLRLGLAGAMMGFMFGSFIYADRNIYTDPAFTKADFRGVTDYLRAHRAPDEMVILVSGHMFPVFDYYMPDAEPIRLPADRTLSTEHVLGYDMADELNAKLAGKSGVWVVRWQDEVVDPNGMLEMLLDSAGERVIVDGAFWHVGLAHYRLPADVRFSTGPQIDHRGEANFGNLIRLLGWSGPEPDSFVLYWQVVQQIPDDLMMSLRLVDDQGLTWGKVDRRPAAYLYPTTRWKPGEVVFGRGDLPAGAGTPPGEYWLEVRVYSAAQPDGLDVLDAAGAPQGRVARAGSFVLKDAGRAWSGSAISLDYQVDYVWQERVALRGVGALPPSASVGETLTVELAWTCLAPTEKPLHATLRLSSVADPDVHHEHPISLFDEYPTTDWRASEWLRSKDVLRLPASWPAGDAELELVMASPLETLEPVVSLGAVLAGVPERVFEEPLDVTVQLNVVAGDLARLIGIVFEPAYSKAGQPFAATLYWGPLRETSRSYTAFVHLLDTGGQIVAQYDRIPVDGERPTTGWVAGEVIADHYAFEALPAGNGSSLAIGLYDSHSAGMTRLEWIGEAGESLGDMLRVPVPTPK